MSRDNTWSFREQWQITGLLTTISNLHVGSGDVIFHNELEVDSEPVEINSVFSDVDNRPFIPGSTLKGALRSRLGDFLHNPSLEIVDEIFGRPPDEKSNGQGGRAEFMDARLAFPRSDTIMPLPFRDPDRQTFIEAGVAIDRQRRTAIDRKLIHAEAVPPGVVFRVTVQGPMKEEHAGFIMALLECFNDPERPVLIGADTGSGKGRMSWELAEVKRFGEEEALAWLKLKEKPMISRAMKTLADKETSLMLRDGRACLKVQAELSKSTGHAGKEPTVLDISLRLDGPFLVNDPPSRSERDEKSRLREKGEYSDNLPDHRPLRNILGLPHLPVRSFRGALRSQAERIARTLAISCCDPAGPCDSIHKIDNVKGLCPVCRLFGASGWKSPIDIPDFDFVTCVADSVRQDFVAIDRFTGGAMPGAKFDADYVYKPEFQGKLIIDWERFNEADINIQQLKGLLTLVLRDLKEGDICLGFGRAKGYGACHAEIKGLESLDPDKSARAFSEKPLQKAAADCVMAGRSGCSREKDTRERSQNKKGNPLFHNPYHFVPAVKPDISTWLNTDKFLNDYKGHHTHSLYHDAIEDTDKNAKGKKEKKEKKVYHGRIICRLETKTPFFTGGRRIPGTEPQEICPFMLEGEPAIPATSLRGLLSSIAEAASCSSLRVLDDTLLSVRVHYKKPLTKMGIIVEHEGVLKLRSLGKPKKYKLEIDPKIIIDGVEIDSESIIKGAKKPLSEQAEAGVDEKFEEFFYMKRENDRNKIPEFSSDNKGKKKGWIRGKFHVMAGELRDFPKTKSNNHNEYFIAVPEDSTGNVKPYDITEALELFYEMADLRTDTQKKKRKLPACEILPYHPLGTRRNSDQKRSGRRLRLKAGDIVYYAKEDGKVRRISISQIWREPKPRVWKFFSEISPELLPFNPERTHISPAELLFGFVENRKKQKTGEPAQKQKDDAALAFAGKVRVSFGRLAHNQADSNIYGDPVTLKVLASPKPPSPALYFRNDGYVSKEDLDSNNNILPQGRKHYLHCLQKNGDIVKMNEKGISQKQEKGFMLLPWESKSNQFKQHEKDERANLKARITPLKKGVVFYFHVDFDNLSRKELELLCYSIRPDKDFQHKSGMGKPIGLGSVSIEPTGLLLINRGRRYRNGLDASRYNDRVWLDQKYEEEYSALYPDESIMAVSKKHVLTPGQLAENFAANMHPDIKKALNLLGNPDNVKVPVHYPQAKDEDIEEENFKWFVANDVGTNNGKKGRAKKSNSPVQDFIKPLNEQSNKLPELERHEWLGKSYR